MALLLYIISIIMLILAAFGFPSRPNLGWLGMALFVFTFAVLGHVNLS